MKKLLIFCLVAVMMAATGYAEVNTMTAGVVMTTHKAAVAKSEKDKGYLYFKRPGKFCLSVNGGKSAMIMNGNTYTMVRGKHKSVAKGETAAYFKTLQTVLNTVITGGHIGSLESLPGVTVSGSTITIVPTGKKKQMFSSFVVALSGKQLQSLKMNGKGKNYTLYTFSSREYNKAVSDAVFVK